MKEIKKDEKDSHSTICGDNSWIQYKDEKCIKFFNTTEEYLVNYENALKFCKKQDSRGNIIIIKTKEEQQFIEKYLFENNFEFDDECIWIGAKNNSKRYIWEDNTTMNYTNWSNDLENDETHKCAAIITKKKNKGKWTDFSCNKKNLIFCQKSQQWTFQDLKENFLQSKKEIQDTSFDTIKKLDILQQNPVPIGFIYVQMPSQAAPKTLWPLVEWKDVTSEYAGLFFRAEGGNSEAFGKLQSDNTPRITDVETKMNSSMLHRFENKYLDYGWSTYFYTGDNTKIAQSEINGEIGVRFYVSLGEVRPINKAVRIWKRIK